MAAQLKDEASALGVHSCYESPNPKGLGLLLGARVGFGTIDPRTVRLAAQ